MDEEQALLDYWRAARTYRRAPAGLKESTALGLVRSVMLRTTKEPFRTRLAAIVARHLAPKTPANDRA